MTDNEDVIEDEGEVEDRMWKAESSNKPTSDNFEHSGKNEPLDLTQDAMPEEADNQ